MPPLLNPISDAQLRSMVSPAQFRQAEAHLRAGKLIGRYFTEDGGVAALWDWSPKAYVVALVAQGNQIYTSCDCGRNQARNLCDHVATLLMAWARQPETFVEESELAELGEVEEFPEEETFAGEALRGAGARPGPPPALEGLALPLIEGTETLRLAPPEVKGEFARLLSEVNATALRDLAARHSVALAGRSREAMLDALADALSRPEAWRAAWDKLSPTARLALAVVPFARQLSDSAPVSAIRQLVQGLTPISANQFEAALQELNAAGLAFNDRYGGLSTPRALPASLPPAPGFLAPIKAGTESALRAAPTPGPLDFALFVTRLLLVLRAEGPRLRARPAPAPHPLLPHLPTLQNWPYVPAELDALAKEPNPAGAAYRQNFTIPPAPSPLTDESRAALNRALGGGDTDRRGDSERRNADLERLDFALRLLRFLGLVELAHGRPVRVLDEHLMDFLKLPPAQRLTPLIDGWLALDSWTEFDRLAARRPPVVLRHLGAGYISSYDHLLAELAVARAGLVHQIRQAPRGVWSEVSALAARARTLNGPQNAVFPISATSWYPDWNKRRPNLTQARDWDAIYGPYVEAALTGPLHWLGLVELGYAKEQLRAFRLSPLGAFVFRQADTFSLPPAPPAGRALTFGSDGSLSLRAEGAGSDLLTLLSLLGDLEGSTHGELRYTIGAAGASRAFEAGWDADQILAALRQAAGSAPPRALAENLKGWRESFGSVQIYSRVALLELADDYALAELLASTSLANYLLYRFSPRLAALRPEGLEALQAELEKKGYTPKVAPSSPTLPPRGEGSQAPTPDPRLRAVRKGANGRGDR